MNVFITSLDERQFADNEKTHAALHLKSFTALYHNCIYQSKRGLSQKGVFTTLQTRSCM